jgi:hypothetical protein
MATVSTKTCLLGPPVATILSTKFQLISVSQSYLYLHFSFFWRSEHVSHRPQSFLEEMETGLSNACPLMKESNEYHYNKESHQLEETFGDLNVLFSNNLLDILGEQEGEEFTPLPPKSDQNFVCALFLRKQYH